MVYYPRTIHIPENLKILVLLCHSENILPIDYSVDRLCIEIERDYVNFIIQNPEKEYNSNTIIMIIEKYVTNRIKKGSKTPKIINKLVTRMKIKKFSLMI